MTTLTDTARHLHLAADAAWPDPTPRLVLADHYEDAGDRVEAALQRVLAEPASDERRLEYAEALERTEGIKCPECLGAGSINMGLADAFCTTCSGRIWVPGGGYWRGTGTVCPRAEFVRVQVELAQVEAIEHDCGKAGEWESTCPACGAYGAAEELRRRERELRQRYAPIWFALPDLAVASVWDHPPEVRWCEADDHHEGVDVVTGDTRRGFLDSVTLPWEAWRLHGPAIVRRHPVTRVALAGREPDELWYWWRDNEAGLYKHNPAYIRPDLFTLLPTINNLIAGARFDTRDAALDALSNACLAWAWKQREGGGS